MKRSEDVAGGAAEVAVVIEAGSETEAEAQTDVGRGKEIVRERECEIAVQLVQIGTETDLLTIIEAEVLIVPGLEALIGLGTEALGMPETEGVTMMTFEGVGGVLKREAHETGVQAVKELLPETGIATESLVVKEYVTAAERDRQAFLLKVHDSAAQTGLVMVSRDSLIAAETPLLAATWTVRTSAAPADGEMTALIGTVT